MGVWWYEKEVDAVVADDISQAHHFLSGVHLVVDVKQNHVVPLMRLEVISNRFQEQHVLHLVDWTRHNLASNNALLPQQNYCHQILLAFLGRYLGPFAKIFGDGEGAFIEEIYFGVFALLHVAHCQRKLVPHLLY